jgi:hypothetical protein
MLVYNAEKNTETKVVYSFKRPITTHNFRILMWCQCHSQLKILYVHHTVTDWEVKNHNAMTCSTSINEIRSTGSMFGSGTQTAWPLQPTFFVFPLAKKVALSTILRVLHNITHWIFKWFMTMQWFFMRNMADKCMYRCINLLYINNVAPDMFWLYCGPVQGGALQSRYYTECQNNEVYKYKLLSFNYQVNTLYL